MRSFPSASRRRLGAVATALVVSLGVTALPLASSGSAQVAAGASADDLKDRKKKAEREVEQAERDFEMSSNRLVRASQRLDAARLDLSAARTTLSGVRADLAEAQARDVEMQAELVAAREDLADARADLVDGEDDLADQHDAVADLVSTIYEQGDPDLLALIGALAAEDASDLTRQEEARDVALDQETDAFDRFSAAEVQLQVDEYATEQAEQEVADQAEAAADHLAVIEGLEADAEAGRDDVVTLVSERASAQAESRAARADDREKVREARADDRRLAAAIKEAARKAREAARRAREQARKERERARREGRETPPAPPVTSDGTLGRPVPGTITSPFGYRVHPIWGYYAMHDGTDFRAACGEPMYAGADGVVLEEYHQSAYGNRLVINHGYLGGAGVATIFNHASSYVVSVGERVTRGQVVGYAGDTGWSTACHLHFTVMADGKPVDPAGWF